MDPDRPTGVEEDATPWDGDEELRPVALEEGLPELFTPDVDPVKRRAWFDALIQKGLDSADRGEFVDPKTVWDELGTIINAHRK